MKIRNAGRFLKRYHRASRSFAYASKRNLVGIEYGRFGRRIGWRLLANGELLGLRFLIAPVNNTRYIEFAFARDALLPQMKNCLDVSSPVLFSLYMAHCMPDISITVLNPDADDITTTKKIIRTNNIPIHRVDLGAIDDLHLSSPRYDCIWSLSVLEHISGPYDDSDSIRMLYDVLNSGGRLIITVPVDRQYWIEYRDQDYYGTQQEEKGRYFFQRFYDLQAIRERLLAPIGQQASQIRWFGEIEEGHFHEYIQRWLKDGVDSIVDDPRDIVDHYQEYEQWEDMAGAGVCGIVVDKD